MLRLFLRIFGSGELPVDGYNFVEKEGKRVVESRLFGSVTFRNFRAPARYSWRRRQWFLGSIAVTGKRILAYRYGSCMLNVPFDDDRITSLRVWIDGHSTVCIAFDVSMFNEGWSGEIEIRMQTPHALDVINAVRSNARQHERITAV
jgi:hypothetical protein